MFLPDCGWSRSRIRCPKMVGPSFLGSASLWWTLCALQAWEVKIEDDMMYVFVFIYIILYNIYIHT